MIDTTPAFINWLYSRDIVLAFEMPDGEMVNVLEERDAALLHRLFVEGEEP
jgi:hypothetical protein